MDVRGDMGTGCGDAAAMDLALCFQRRRCVVSVIYLPLYDRADRRVRFWNMSHFEVDHFLGLPNLTRGRCVLDLPLEL